MFLKKSVISATSTLPYMMWLSIFIAIGFSLRQPVPLVWGDSPGFLESALLTLASGSPITVDGRDTAYPTLLAFVFAHGGNLSDIVLLQQASWALTVVLVAWTVVHVTGRHLTLIPVLLLAIYPGELIYRHIVLAESFYSVTLALVGCLAVLAIQSTGRVRSTTLAFGTLIAGIAACLKSIGLFVVVLMVLLSLWFVIRRLAWHSGFIIVSVIAAISLVAGNSYVRSSSPDPYSHLFVQKTLFCNHADIFLKSEGARQLATALLGDTSGRFLARVSEDVSSKSQSWPTLGFYADACQFDPELDRLASENSKGVGAAKVYRSLFLSSLGDSPLDYARKVFHQIRYGLVMAWPPNGGVELIKNTESAYTRVSQLMSGNESRDKIGLSESASVSGWSQGTLEVYLWRIVSLVVAAVVLGTPIAWIFRARLNRTLLVQLSLVSALWFSSIVIPALTTTLDIWRYISPSTPLAALAVALGISMLIDCSAQRKFGFPNRMQRQPLRQGTSIAAPLA